VTSSPDPGSLLALFEEQVRVRVPDPLPAGMTIERDGPLLRLAGAGPAFLLYRDLDGVDGAALDELIARQAAIFTERGEEVEWKHYSHDLPADLPARLMAHGFMPEDEETVVIGPVAPLAEAPPRFIPPVRFRAVTERRDFEAIVRMEEEVWGHGSRGHLVEILESEIAADPESIDIIVAEIGAVVVSAGWIRYEIGTQFASLWGGSTLPDWRGRGVYKAIVEHRARLAAAKGYTYLQVDASPDSRPILERLGFVAVTTTTPYVFTPPAA
jgi:GNAT superfamily N-acetyltransferase